MSVSIRCVVAALCFHAGPAVASRQLPTAARQVKETTAGADLRDDFWSDMDSELKRVGGAETAAVPTAMLSLSNPPDPAAQAPYSNSEQATDTVVQQPAQAADTVVQPQATQAAEGALQPQAADPEAGVQPQAVVETDVQPEAEADVQPQVQAGRTLAPRPTPLEDTDVQPQESQATETDTQPQPTPVVDTDEKSQAVETDTLSHMASREAQLRELLSRRTLEPTTAPTAMQQEDDLQEPPSGLNALEDVQDRIDAARAELRNMHQRHHRHVIRAADRTRAVVSDAASTMAEKLDGLRRENAVLRRALRQRDTMENVIQANALARRREEEETQTVGLTGTYVAFLICFDLLVAVGLYFNHRYIREQPLDSSPSGLLGGSFGRVLRFIDDNMGELITLTLLVQVGLLLVKSDIFGNEWWTFVGNGFTIGVVCVLAYVVHTYFARQRTGGKASSSGIGGETRGNVTGADVYTRFEPGSGQGSLDNTQGPSVQKREKSGACC